MPRCHPWRKTLCPSLPTALLQTGELRSFDYAPNPGTHWIRSCLPVQEMSLLVAPLRNWWHTDKKWPCGFIPILTCWGAMALCRFRPGTKARVNAQA